MLLAGIIAFTLAYRRPGRGSRDVLTALTKIWDSVAGAFVVCRSAAGVCDLAETCTGNSASCPADVKSHAVCRPSAGPCDLPESCDGVSDQCPADAFQRVGDRHHPTRRADPRPP